MQSKEISKKKFLEASKNFKAGIFNFCDGFFMQPVSISKTWGKEIWYSGIEERGVCQVKSIENNFTTPLPYVLEILQALEILEDFKNLKFSKSKNNLQKKEKIILVKQLVPLAQKEKGNLYYELHEKKKEIYIVNKISKIAYPEKIGKIKIGMNQNHREQFSSFKKFKDSFLEIAKQCKKIIDDISKSNEEKKQNRELKKKYFQQLEPFFRYVDLQVGDVIRISPFIPHSLQHGVSVIEFQTQHYERAILSFEQKVITQNHWDTEKALVPLKEKDIFAHEKKFKNDLKKINKKIKNTSFEKIKGFDEFFIERITTENSNFSIKEKNYFILFIISGAITVTIKNQKEKKILLKKNNCFYFPKQFKKIKITSDQKSIFLKATPQ